MGQTHKEKVEKLKKALPDVQKNKDDRGISINRVGVEDIKFPLFITTKEGGENLVTATINLYGSLRHQVKGVSMSRFIEILMKWKFKNIDRNSLEQLLIELRDHLGKEDVEDVYIEISFDYFITKTTPISNQECVMSYPCTFTARLKEYYKFWLKVEVLASSSCPCSKEISTMGAHNQRSHIIVNVEPLRGNLIWLEDLIKTIEKCGSCEIWSLLKRVDEKYVTETAYSNSKFCEDIARQTSLALQEMGSLSKFKIKVCNDESIHQHNAVSYVARRLKGDSWVKDGGGLKH